MTPYQETFRFSTFELVKDHNVRGPMRILCELWTKEVSDPKIKTTYQYVLGLIDRLQSTCQKAKENSGRSVYYYNLRVRQGNMKKDESS